MQKVSVEALVHRVALGIYAFYGTVDLLMCKNGEMRILSLDKMDGSRRLCLLIDRSLLLIESRGLSSTETCLEFLVLSTLFRQARNGWQT